MHLSHLKKCLATQYFLSGYPLLLRNFHFPEATLRIRLEEVQVFACSIVLKDFLPSLLRICQSIQCIYFPHFQSLYRYCVLVAGFPE